MQGHTVHEGLGLVLQVRAERIADGIRVHKLKEQKRQGFVKCGS